MISAKAIRRCGEYSVESPDGHIGTVAEIRYSSGAGTPTSLAVRAGRAGSRLLIIPVSQLAGINPPQHEVTLRASPDITASEPSHPDPSTTPDTAPQQPRCAIPTPLRSRAEQVTEELAAEEAGKSAS